MSELLPALGAGIVSTFVCNPLDVIRINYQLNYKIEYTFTKLYKGVNYGMIAIPSFWTIYFPIYKNLKEKDVPTPISAYMSSGLAATFTTPFWVLRQTVQTDKEIPKFTFRNYYKGIIPTYLLNLNFTVQMPLYEYLKDKTNNSTFNTFLNTSLSKTVATCIFYPFDTIRTRIRNGDPIKGLKFKEYYKGMSIYLIRSIPYYTSVFCTFEFIKNLMYDNP